MPQFHVNFYSFSWFGFELTSKNNKVFGGLIVFVEFSTTRDIFCLLLFQMWKIDFRVSNEKDFKVHLISLFMVDVSFITLETFTTNHGNCLYALSRY